MQGPYDGLVLDAGFSPLTRDTINFLNDLGTDLAETGRVRLSLSLSLSAPNVFSSPRVFHSKKDLILAVSPAAKASQLVRLLSLFSLLSFVPHFFFFAGGVDGRDGVLSDELRLQ